MTVSNEFFFIAGSPALDFVNTEIVRAGRPEDLLDSPESLARWLADAGLAPSPRSVTVSAAGLAAAKRTRAALRDISGALASGQAPRQASVAVIDAELRRGRGTLTLRSGPAGFSHGFEPEHRLDPRLLVARLAAEFLVNADPARIHRCEGTNCILFFYDATKSGTRRWCSMSGCGNRMKAAAHYRRTRAGT